MGLANWLYFRLPVALCFLKTASLCFLLLGATKVVKKKTDRERQRGHRSIYDMMTQRKKTQSLMCFEKVHAVLMPQLHCFHGYWSVFAYSSRTYLLFDILSYKKWRAHKAGSLCFYVILWKMVQTIRHRTVHIFMLWCIYFLVNVVLVKYSLSLLMVTAHTDSVSLPVL